MGLSQCMYCREYVKYITVKGTFYHFLLHLLTFIHTQNKELQNITKLNSSKLITFFLSAAELFKNNRTFQNNADETKFCKENNKLCQPFWGIYMMPPSPKQFPAWVPQIFSFPFFLKTTI